MVALAEIHDEPWFYYPFFIAFFLFFVPIPAAAGMLMAWILARFLNQRLRRRLIIAACIVAAGVTVWFVQTVPIAEDQPHVWINRFLSRLKFVHWALLPSTWVSRGVEAAMQYRPSEALAYLGVTLANALFLSVVAVRVVSRRFSVAFDRALSMRGGERRTSVEPRGGICGLVFFYLPLRQRLIAAKDFRTFLRDPLQWTQLVILFGLMALYLLNLPRFTNGVNPLDGWGMIIPFLNFGAISFILATFTSRFVFPLVSLEGQQMWLIGLLPLSPNELLAAKFAFAMTVTVGVALSTTVLAVVMLQMPAAWAAVQIITMLAVCTGLCGLAVGLGARLPEFTQRNAARIANGFGGTVNLVASVVLVLTMLIGMAYLGVRNRLDGFAGPVSSFALVIAGAVTALGALTGVGALSLGARHLRRSDV
jgi:ABC-2 type transport system permease protein